MIWSCPHILFHFHNCKLWASSMVSWSTYNVDGLIYYYCSLSRSGGGRGVLTVTLIDWYTLKKVVTLIVILPSSNYLLKRVGETFQWTIIIMCIVWYTQKYNSIHMYMHEQRMLTFTQQGEEPSNNHGNILATKRSWINNNNIIFSA